ncbi:hypothetical protein U9M48_004329 [Paspalum notatum var. saurae]|uniref:Uncharacterized protein n=1 Tax=Paspalum notatum var. saurae TaxID=547442 RepID=A0AAQ3SER1_PASNO
MAATRYSWSQTPRVSPARQGIDFQAHPVTTITDDGLLALRNSSDYAAHSSPPRQPCSNNMKSWWLCRINFDRGLFVPLCCNGMQLLHCFNCCRAVPMDRNNTSRAQHLQT